MLNIHNRFNSFIKSVEYMKQNLIERQGYSDRIECICLVRVWLLPLLVKGVWVRVVL